MIFNFFKSIEKCIFFNIKDFEKENINIIIKNKYKEFLNNNVSDIYEENNIEYLENNKEKLDLWNKI